MIEDIHERATNLFDKMHVEGITAEEHDWLGAHLESCAQCLKRGSETERALRALRSALLRFDDTLVRTTQVRARIRARELVENAVRMRALWISCALSWVLGVASAPLLWRGFRWIGYHLALSRAVWMTGFALSWVVPAAVAAAIIAWRQVRGSTVTERR